VCAPTKPEKVENGATIDAPNQSVAPLPSEGRTSYRTHLLRWPAMRDRTRLNSVLKRPL
jgi:hypothetical protein